MSEIDVAIEVMDRAMDDIAELRRLLAAAIAERDAARALLREAETLLRNTISVPDLRARIAAELEPKS